jgi:NTP pyrophosphatase (non-canonical NTP hydrolase)
MGLNEYQKQAHSFAMYQSEDYPVYMLASEIGELIGKYGKRLRGDTVPEVDIKKEIGDIMWGIAEIATQQNIDLQFIALTQLNFDFNFETNKCLFKKLTIISSKLFDRNNIIMTLAEIMECIDNLIIKENWDFEEILLLNIEKLTSRLERNTIQGSGDNR